MIKIQKPAAPQVLVNNKATWTQNLLDAIATYGEYSKIPESEKTDYCLIIGTKTSKMHYLQVVIINVHFVNVYQEKAVILRLSILSPNPYTPI